jgi:ABC-type branched-subunit amino acid transport system substrate-binding protein
MKTPVVTANPIPKPTPEHAFYIMASFSDLTYHLANYLITQRGVKKLGYLYQNDDLGEMGRIGLAKALKEHNVELAADVGYERGANDLSTQVLKLKDAEADAVIVMGTAPAIAAVMKYAATVGYDTTWATHGAIGADVVHKLLGDKVNGLVFASESDNQFADTPEMHQALVTIRKYFPDTQIDYNLLLGYATGRVAIEGLRTAGRDLTREKFIAAIENLTYFNTDVVPLSYSKEKHNGANGVKIYRWIDGKPAAQTDWLPLEK